MKNFIITMLAVWAFGLNSNAQDLSPVVWSAEISETDSGNFALFTASVQDGWYVYGQTIPDGGPIPTEVIIYEGTESLQGKIFEWGPNKKEGFDDLFSMDIVKYARKLYLQQRIEGEQKSVISGTVTYMCCNDESCLPPKDFEFSLQIP